MLNLIIDDIVLLATEERSATEPSTAAMCSGPWACL